MSGGRHIGLILVAAGGLGLGGGCASKPALVAESQRPSWMPPEMKCPQEAPEQMKKMGLMLGDRIPVVVDETQNRPGSARYKSRFVMSVPKVEEGELKDVSIAGYLYVANHRVFGRYDRAYVRYYEDGKVRDFYEVPFCGVLLDPRWDKDGEGILSYPGPERGTAVVQDARGVILVVDRFP
ncbi:hypothetical protein [Stigmatella erecta]|uniref:Lipoprotein n=1 Tax=Stigmatella erecta TaxID=83460 RepID=A0A1I0DDU7_9BACT|nr:hypothetical protein [Stigmatella erecta]SET30506.1 hypothetical protein SAMN05443639_102491 [Stigmatella erecta]